MRSGLADSLALASLPKYKAIFLKIQSSLYFLLYLQVGYLKEEEAYRQG
jgi:hypothetical protein